MQQAISMVLKQAESTRSKDIRLVRPQNRFSTKPNTLEKTRHVMAPGWELLKKEEKGAWNRNRMGGIGLDWACQWELSTRSALFTTSCANCGKIQTGE